MFSKSIKSRKSKNAATPISRFKNKISPKNRCECDQEVRTLKAISHQVMIVYLLNFRKLLLKYLKQPT